MKHWTELGEQHLPEPLVFNLLKEEEAINLTKSFEETNWEYLFANQREYQELMANYHQQRKAIVRPPQYEYAVFTNENPLDVQIETEISGTKVWLDDQSDQRPPAISVYLVANGKIVDKQIVTAETKWTYRFTNIALYDEAGERIHYAVKEEPVPGYQTSYEGYQIKNVRAAKTEGHVLKTWPANQRAQQPDSIPVTLLQNGEKIKRVALSKQNNWQYHFKELDAFDAQGKPFFYTVEEDWATKDGMNPIKFKMDAGKIVDEQKVWNVGAAIAGGALVLLGLATKLRKKD